jgi:hypothetical protein
MIVKLTVVAGRLFAILGHRELTCIRTFLAYYCIGSKFGPPAPLCVDALPLAVLFIIRRPGRFTFLKRREGEY